MKIAILGTGNMGKALIAGLRRKYGEGISIIAWDRNADAMKSLDGAVTVMEPAKWLAGESVPDAVLIAVKPFDVAAAMAPITGSGGKKLTSPLWVSIAAGKSIAVLRKLFPKGADAEVRLCRVMPNTPALIDEAISAYTLSDNATEKDAEIAEKIFHACGKTVAVPEKFMNAVTGLSGTGPAYVFFFLESLIEAGVMAGLPQRIARECALQTVIGAAKLASVSPESLADLKMKVMTPAGTTASACMVLEHHAFKHAIIKAVIAATRRSEQMEK
ncbi:MAG: pyrroline-5-carboxylate reductase [Chitinispirillaceae bacterium]|nr:pyrroline-5-carboxylate reductase [Chitinispirillaceae bacterium]